MVRQEGWSFQDGTLICEAAVMNLTEMESMVREATNADPWGAPSKRRHTDSKRALC